LRETPPEKDQVILINDKVLLDEKFSTSTVENTAGLSPAVWVMIKALARRERLYRKLLGDGTGYPRIGRYKEFEDSVILRLGRQKGWRNDTEFNRTFITVSSWQPPRYLLC
jgi:hypothetical protein